MWQNCGICFRSKCARRAAARTQDIINEKESDKVAGEANIVTMKKKVMILYLKQLQKLEYWLLKMQLKNIQLKQ
jgi:hypothetical protein